MTDWNGRIHPLAEMFPPLESDDDDSLTEDMRSNGLLKALTLDCDGTLVDGINRLRRCDALGIAPRFEVLPEGTDIAKYVISVNIVRRHLDAGQRAMLVAKIRKVCDKPLTTPDAAEEADASRSRMKFAAVVLGHGTPELVDQVVNGETTLDDAYYQVRPTPPSPKSSARRPARSKPKPAPGNGTSTTHDQDEEQEQVETDTRNLTLLGRRAFLFFDVWGTRRCYVLLVNDGQVVESLDQLKGSDRMGLGTWLDLLGKDHYDPYFKAWWVGKGRTDELMEELDGDGIASKAFGGNPWPHNDPRVTVRPPEQLDIVLMLLSAVSPGKRDKLAKAITAAVHPDGEERKQRPAEVDELSYVMGDVQTFVGSTADQKALWTLLRQGWSVPTSPVSRK